MSNTPQCLKATLLHAAYSVPVDRLPADTQAMRLERDCPYRNDDGDGCRLRNPMLFVRQNVGVVALGTENFCQLELDDPGAFKKAALALT